MKRRSFMPVLAAGGAVIALPGCDTVPAAATAPRSAPGAAETDARLRALSWAQLAPNTHCLQSWPGLIRLSVDQLRRLPATDPPNRQMLIDCGAFLELLCQAAAQPGQRAEVTLLPEREHAATGVDARPFAAVQLRRTDRAAGCDHVPDAPTPARAGPGSPGRRLPPMPADDRFRSEPGADQPGDSHWCAS